MKPSKDLIQRHKPLTKKQVVENFEAMREMKANITTDAAILEENLKKFNQIEDPLFDPETKQPLCWIRRPTTSELEALVPIELLEYRDSMDKIPVEVFKKYQDFQFEMMANLITKPKHDVKLEILIFLGYFHWYFVHTISIFK